MRIVEHSRELMWKCGLMPHKNPTHSNCFVVQVCVVILFSTWTYNALGEPPPISTDRILQTNSPDILQPGYSQIETGFYSYETDKENNVKSKHSFLNNTIYRIGFREDMELRVGLYGYNLEHVGSEDNSGVSDGELSTKILLLEGSESNPKTTLNAGFTVPTGNDAFSSDRADPFFSFIPSFTNLFPDSISNDNSLGITWSDANADFKYGTLWGYGISKSVTFYGEFFGSIPIDSGSNSHGFDWGFTWAVKNNLQLDIVAGNSLNDTATDFFMNAGLSMRFPE